MDAPHEHTHDDGSYQVPAEVVIDQLARQLADLHVTVATQAARIAMQDAQLRAVLAASDPEPDGSASPD